MEGHRYKHLITFLYRCPTEIDSETEDTDPETDEENTNILINKMGN